MAGSHIADHIFSASASQSLQVPGLYVVCAGKLSTWKADTSLGCLRTCLPQPFLTGGCLFLQEQSKLLYWGLAGISSVLVCTDSCIHGAGHWLTPSTDLCLSGLTWGLSLRWCVAFLFSWQATELQETANFRPLLLRQSHAWPSGLFSGLQNKCPNHWASP